MVSTLGELFKDVTGIAICHPNGKGVGAGRGSAPVGSASSLSLQLLGLGHCGLPALCWAPPHCSLHLALGRQEEALWSEGDVTPSRGEEGLGQLQGQLLASGLSSAPGLWDL